VNRLWVRLTIAFTLVTLVTLGIVAGLINLRAGEAFRVYLSYSDPYRYEPLVDILGSYYAAEGSWDGVVTLLDKLADSPLTTLTSRSRTQPGLEPAGLQVVLADAKGIVLYDREQHKAGRRLTRDETAAAIAIEVDGKVVGRLVVGIPVQPGLVGPLEQRFFDRVREMLLAGAAIAGVLGILLGLAFSRTLSAPLQRLAVAARAVANHDYSRKVEVRGGAEVADVARAFNEMTSALDQAEQLRKNLMADIAHELRTPLSVVQGNLQAILDDVYPMDKSEIGRLYDQTRLMSRLVEDLRELALADAGKLHMNMQSLDLGRLIHATCDHLTAGAEAEKLALVVEVPADLPSVRADPDRVVQVLHNLLANALRHTPEGGRIDVTASALDESVEITVADTGEGIAPEDLEHIFDRFWKADKARARDERWPGGTGLGLSIAQSLLRAQGGTIRVDSTLGQGSRFHFTLPREQRDQIGRSKRS
jgi:two-component system OmpR family sensor kinase/two-component system sensor histidine kinase BaeS